MLPQEGGFAIMLQETGIATRAQEMHVAAALRDKGYTAYFSSRLAETGATSTSRGGGLLTAVSSKYVAEHEVLSFTEIVHREGRGPGDPHGRGRPHPHQRPRAASRLLPVGGTGGVLGRHTNVCPFLPWSLRESVWARGMAHPQGIGSDHLPVRLALPGLLGAAGHAAMPTP